MGPVGLSRVEASNFYPPPWAPPIPPPGGYFPQDSGLTFCGWNNVSELSGNNNDTSVAYGSANAYYYAGGRNSGMPTSVINVSDNMFTFDMDDIVDNLSAKNVWVEIKTGKMGPGLTQDSITLTLSNCRFVVSEAHQ